MQWTISLCRLPLRFEHIPGTENPADIFTKPLPWASLRVFVEPLLFWKGDTARATGTSTEGSIEGPRYDQVAISATDDPRATSQGGDARVQGTTVLDSSNNGDVLWNNQYAVLAGED